MDKSDEIFKFQALMSLAAGRDEHLAVEIRYQQGVLKALGMSDGEILDQVHDRHARAPISQARARIVLTSVRHAAGLPQRSGTGAAHRPWGPAQTLDERRAQYMRARGMDPRARPPEAPGAAGPSTEARPSPPAAATTARKARPRPGEGAAAASGLLVPYGVATTGQLVHARDANPTAFYACQGCAGILALRSGPIRTRHFAHQAHSVCDGETLLHLTAKLLIAQLINEHHGSTVPLTVRCSCSKCGAPVSRAIPRGAFASVEVEERVGPFVCDVVAFKDTEPVLAIEICNTHAVDGTKAETLEVPWIELNAADVLEDPYNWRPVQMRLKPVLCGACKEERAELERVAQRWQLPLAEPLYVPAAAPCWSCKETIIWYWWLGVPFAQGRPPEPVPRTLQFRFSKMYGGKYWMNTCPGCRAPQGDNFVFLASDSPFNELPLVENEEMIARRNQRSAAALKQFMDVIKRNMGR